MDKRQTNRILGYPDDARLLIINADDFGMCNSINGAIFQTLAAGMVHSTSLMVTCPWAIHAIHFLRDHPDIPFGVHLTVICDSDDYSWGPVSSKNEVPDLVDKGTHFYNFDGFHKLHIPGILTQLEVEFRAQIETVLETGLNPVHLDWHAIRLDNRVEIFDLMLRLAIEFGLAFRIPCQPYIRQIQERGLPCNDFDLVDSYLLNPVEKPKRYAQMLHELPAGLSEWAVHPGFDTMELVAMEPDGNHFRQTDYDFWMSQAAKEIVKEEGIILIDYRAIQEVWNRK